MMLAFRTSICHTLAFSFLPRPSFPFNHYVFCQISSTKFSSSIKMGKSTKSAKSSQPEPLRVGGNSPICKAPVMPYGPLSDTYHDNGEYIMIGSNRVMLCRKNMQNHSLPLSTRVTRCNLSTDKHPELMFTSDHLPLPPTTTVSAHKKLKRRTKVDLGSAQASGDNHGVSSFSSSSENNSLSLTGSFPTTNITSHHDESLHCNHLGKKVASANRPHTSHSNLNYAAAGHKLYSSVSLPKFKPYDICFRRKRNYALIGATLLKKNKESCIEMQEGGTKERILTPGMVLLKHYITHNEQVEIVKICRQLGLGPGGFYQPGYADGAKLRLQMMCLGLDWDPQTRKYENKRLIDGSKPPSIPHRFSMLVKRATKEAHSLINKECGVSNVDDILPSMSPDVCIVNFYTTNGRLGLHQDRDESRESLRKGLPVVSFSIGDSAEFLYGDQRDVEKAGNVLLESGDVLIFGGESRHVFHGVSSIIPNSAPKELLKDTWLCPGRLNLTFRQY